MEKEAETLDEKVKISTKSEQRYRKNKKNKIASIARIARDATLSIKCGSSSLSVIIDLNNFKQAFFNHKTLPDYSRLQPLSKLLVCQYVLHTQHTNLQPYPFVFRLPTELHNETPEKLRKKIQRKLSTSLGRPVLFWTTRENDGGLKKAITHINGELLIHPEELSKVRGAFKGVLNASNKPKKAHIDAKQEKPKLPYHVALVFPVSSRNKQIAEYGKFYAVFNWCGYATKQELDRDSRAVFKAKLLGKEPPETGKFHFISQDLNKIASNFYRESIQKK